MRLQILASLILSASAQPVLAAPSAPTRPPAATAHAAKPDEATVAEAIRLLDADGFDKGAMRSTELMVGVSLAGMIKQMQQTYGDQLPADLLDQVRTAIHDHAMATMRAHLADMKHKTAEIYAEQFTRAELIHLRELHSDPVAVKARERSEIMQPKLMMIGVNTMRDSQPELDAKIKRLIADYLTAHDKSLPGKSSS